MIIKELRVRNFRSIVKADIELEKLSILVGLNDVGKSNVLKALNLFFNGETDYGKKLSFDDDYSKYAPKKQKKAEEIHIELVIQLPDSYSGGKLVKWSKVWRKIGLQSEVMKFLDGKDFPPRSRITAWLLNIRYSYIPAIRDNSYFYELLSNLHDSLAETIENELRTAGDEFIEKIKNNTKSMISEINKRLSIDSQIQLPSNLQSLFRTLDFSTKEGEYQISLSNRGDGIKTRHIPVILKFIADQLNINKTRGSVAVNTIWGYEEPENNLEMITAFRLAEEFVDYSRSIQILLTTYSPGFYTLKENNLNEVRLYKVQKPNGAEAKVSEISNYKDLDEDMGIMPIIAPYVKQKVDDIDRLQNDISLYKKQIENIHKNVIFVEGKDEVVVFSKLLMHFGLDKTVYASKEGMGCTGVKNQIMAWAWVSGVSSYKAFGIFDNDQSGNAELSKLKSEDQFKDAQNKSRVKAISYKAPQHLINIKSKIVTFPIELEEMYPPNIWEYAESEGLLEERSIDELGEFVKLDNARQTIEQKINSFNFSNDEIRYVRYKVPDKNKEKLSTKMVDDRFLNFRDKFLPLEKLFQDNVVKFFK
ncbi:ATP-dependent nuclease [Flavobacterium sp. RNTU_13]|uniref:ATP-dependent nuclease n=1 Tax=Flavobacterium sp. RNTU_13 TaxID=3375145 RepID=UPI00398688C9